MNDLLAKINCVEIEHVLDVDAATLGAQRVAICEWIEFESKRGKKGMPQAAVAAVLESIQRFRAAIQAAQRKAKAQKEVKAIEPEFEELKAQNSKSAFEGAEKVRFDTFSAEIAKLDREFENEQSNVASALEAVWEGIPLKWTPLGNRRGLK
jgi:hypothetical protein